MTAEARPPFPFNRLPVELRLRILSFTHLGSRGDYRDDHSLIYIDNGHTFRSIDETHHPNKVPTGCHHRMLPLNLFLVSRQMHQDAFDVFYRESHFTLAPAYKRPLNFLHRLPPSALQLIRTLRLRASMGDAELIFRNTWTKYSAQHWNDLIEFINDNCDLPNLCISVDLTIVSRWVLKDDAPELIRRATYQYYRFVTSILCTLKTVKDVDFDLAWAGSLTPWMKREILGDRFRGEIPEPESEFQEDLADDELGGVPYWHRNDERVPDSNYIPDESAA